MVSEVEGFSSRTFDGYVNDPLLDLAETDRPLAILGRRNRILLGLIRIPHRVECIAKQCCLGTVGAPDTIVRRVEPEPADGMVNGGVFDGGP